MSTFRIEKDASNFKCCTLRMNVILINADPPEMGGNIKVVPSNLPYSLNVEVEEDKVFALLFLSWNYHNMLIDPMMIILD